jgi:hypothetical protein
MRLFAAIQCKSLAMNHLRAPLRLPNRARSNFVKPNQTIFLTLSTLTLNTHPVISFPALNPVRPKLAGFRVRGNFYPPKLQRRRTRKFADSSHFAFCILNSAFPPALHHSIPLRIFHLPP